MEDENIVRRLHIVIVVGQVDLHHRLRVGHSHETGASIVAEAKSHVAHVLIVGDCQHARLVGRHWELPQVGLAACHVELTSRIVAVAEEDEAFDTNVAGAARLLRLLPVESLASTLVLDAGGADIGRALARVRRDNIAITAEATSGAVGDSTAGSSAAG